MGQSQARALHFEKNIRNQPTADEYVLALAASPYRTHRRMAQALSGLLTQFKKDANEAEVEVLKATESRDFASKLGVTI